MLDDVDLVLVMTVNPGFGGQKFITGQLKKIEAIANRIAKQNLAVSWRSTAGSTPRPRRRRRRRSHCAGRRNRGVPGRPRPLCGQYPGAQGEG